MNASPIPVAEFERWLRLGFGRAILYLKTRDSAPYRDAILRACSNDWRCDPQCEEPRAEYLWELLDATRSPAGYRDAIVSGLRDAEEDLGEVQLFQLARRYAQAGDAEARSLLYHRFENDNERDPVSALELVELDGVDGLLFVAGLLGQDAEENDWHCSYVLNRVGETSNVEMHRALERAAAESAGIRRFLWAVEQDQRRAERYRSTPEDFDPVGLPYAELRLLLRERKGLRRLKAWGQYASDADIVAAAGDFAELVTQGSDHRRWRPYVQVFRERAYPLDLRPIVAAAQSTKSSREYHILVGLLRTIEHPVVRAAALRCLESGEQPDLGINLLFANYAEGDLLLIERAVERIVDQAVLHSCGTAVYEFLKQHPLKQAVPILHHLYEHGPCSMCREDFVELLIEYDALPARLAEECRYDANQSLRRLIAKRYGG